MKEINPNLVWTAVIAKQLGNLGVKHVIIAAGSRSTPLSLAFASHTQFQVYSQVDERSAGYFALGIAKSTEKPVVLISTSGTATANFYPAVIEANAAAVPLLIFTADRPHDLRISGANQTTDQIKLYGDQVNWFSDVSPPKDEIKIRELRYLSQLATSAYQYAMFPQKGPVHLNFPFRKPLQPTADQIQEITPNGIIEALELNIPQIQLIMGSPILSEVTEDQVRQLLQERQSLLIVAGPDAYRELDPKLLNRFMTTTNAIALVDPLSGYRYTSHGNTDGYIQAYETFLQFKSNLPVPDLVVQVGMMPTSKYLSQWLSNIDTDWMVVSSRSDFTDGVLASTIRVKAAPSALFKMLTDELNKINTKSFNKSWINTDKKCRELLSSSIKDEKFEPYLINRIFDLLPESHVFIANSLAPRYFDQFIFSNTLRSPIRIYSNRGVSGIDGTLSSALGITSTVDEPSYLITGDLAFYHDMNGLLAMMRYKLPLKIIIINNGGGAIFDRLPISSFKDVFDEFFLTEHKLHFDKIAAQFDITYLQFHAGDIDWNQISKDLQTHDQIIVELVTDPKQVESKRRGIIENLKDQLQ